MRRLAPIHDCDSDGSLFQPFGSILDLGTHLIAAYVPRFSFGPRKQTAMVKSRKAAVSGELPNVVSITTGRGAPTLKNLRRSRLTIDDQSKGEGNLQKWLLGIAQNNHDLVTALEGLRDSYKDLLSERPVSDAHQAVLLGVEFTLMGAKTIRLLG
jgi:hypothetical protein